MYIAVCDDQIEELEKLTALLQAWQSDRRSDVRFQTFRSGGQLLDAARAERFTLYLLDVLMPGMTGMDAAREIRSFDAAADIIFLTTSPGFAYESYGVRAAEYLLGRKAILPYKLLFLAVVVFSPVLALDLVWSIADILNALMAIPNLIAVLLLSGVIASETRHYLNNLDEEDTTELPVIDR